MVDNVEVEISIEMEWFHWHAAIFMSGDNVCCNKMSLARGKMEKPMKGSPCVFLLL